MILPGILSSQISGHLFTLTGSYDALATVTVPSGGASSIVFSGIPQTGYKHLQLRMTHRTSVATTDDNVVGTFNNDTAGNYVTHYISTSGGGSVQGAIVGTSANVIFFSRTPGASSTANVFGTGVVDILDYTSSNKNKTIRSLSGWDSNGTGQLWYWSGAWLSTAPISSIQINGSWAQYSQFSLYGIK